MREGRHLVAEDFASVAQDLVKRGITTVEQLGAQGGSNGGLLMGIMLTQYPELFGALVCSVPLLDMRRFHLLLAGASWGAEDGDPDNPDDWGFLSKYSPYQNVLRARRDPFPPGVAGHSGAWSSRRRVMCSIVSARRPPMTAVYQNRCAAPVPASIRPALISNGLSASATSRW